MWKDESESTAQFECETLDSPKHSRLLIPTGKKKQSQASQSTFLLTKINGQIFSLFSFLWNFRAPLGSAHSLTTLSLTNLWRALDFMKKGGEMKSGAGGGGRVLLKGLLHTM